MVRISSFVCALPSLVWFVWEQIHYVGEFVLSWCGAGGRLESGCRGSGLGSKRTLEEYKTLLLDVSLHANVSDRCVWTPDPVGVSYPNFWPKNLLSYTLWPRIFSSFSEKNSAERYFKIPHLYQFRPLFSLFFIFLFITLLVLSYLLFSIF